MSDGEVPMIGLSDVDYSDIQAEFDRYATPSLTFGERWASPYDDFQKGSFGIVGMREKGGSLIAQVRRAENKIYGYKEGARIGKRFVRKYGEGKVASGFVDAIFSVVKDVDVYDPQNEMDIFMKYLLIKADFVGGQCCFCKHDNLWTKSVSSERGFMYKYFCKSCKSMFTPKTGALFHRTYLSMPQLMDSVRISLDPSGISLERMAHLTNTTKKTAYTIRTLIRNNSLLGERWPNEQSGEHHVNDKSHRRAKPVLLGGFDKLYEYATTIVDPRTGRPFKK